MLHRTLAVQFSWNAGRMEAAYYGGFDPGELREQTFSVPSRRGTHWLPTTALKVLPDTTEAGVNQIVSSLSGGKYALVMWERKTLSTPPVSGIEPHRHGIRCG